VKNALLLFAVYSIAVSLTSGATQFETALWKQKVLLLQSTRADVENVLGKPSSGQGYLVTYKLSDGIVDLEYYPFDHCKISDGVQADLNLPEWTVTEIVFRPKRQVSISTLHLNLKRLRKAHLNPGVPDLVSYLDDREGIEYTVESNGTLNNVRYFPGSRYGRLRCPKG
jgi:hypothetical protein